MRKIVTMVVMLGMLLCFSSPSFAILRKDMDAVRGTVVSTDPSSAQVTIKAETNGEEMTFVVKRGVDENLEAGTRVVIIFKKGTNQATSLRPITRRAKQ